MSVPEQKIYNSADLFRTNMFSVSDPHKFEHLLRGFIHGVEYVRADYDHFYIHGKKTQYALPLEFRSEIANDMATTTNFYYGSVTADSVRMLSELHYDLASVPNIKAYEIEQIDEDEDETCYAEPIANPNTKYGMRSIYNDVKARTDAIYDSELAFPIPKRLKHVLFLAKAGVPVFTDAARRKPKQDKREQVEFTGKLLDNLRIVNSQADYYDEDGVGILDDYPISNIALKYYLEHTVGALNNREFVIEIPDKITKLCMPYFDELYYRVPDDDYLKLAASFRKDKVNGDYDIAKFFEQMQAILNTPMIYTYVNPYGESSCMDLKVYRVTKDDIECLIHGNAFAHVNEVAVRKSLKKASRLKELASQISAEAAAIEDIFSDSEIQTP